MTFQSSPVQSALRFSLASSMPLFPVSSICCPSVPRMHHASDGLGTFVQTIPSTQSPPSTPWSLELMNMSQGKRHFAGVIKSSVLSKEMILDCPSGPNIMLRPYGREVGGSEWKAEVRTEAEVRNVMLYCRMEPCTEESEWPQKEGGEDKEADDLHESQEDTSSANFLNVSPVKLTSDFRPPECKNCALSHKLCSNLCNSN